MNEASISIIIPCYNTGQQALSLIKKLVKDNHDYEGKIEIICINDGSTDDSLEILKNGVKSLDSKKLTINILNQGNTGAAGARNLGIRKAKGEFLMFIDSDDEVEKDFVKELTGAMQEKVSMAAVGFVYKRLKDGTCKNVGTEPTPKKRGEEKNVYILRMLTQNSKLYSVINKIFRTKIVKMNSIEFKQGVDFGEDTMFVLDYLAVAEGELVMINKPLYIYNYGTDTSTVASSSLVWKNWEKLYGYVKKWGVGSLEEKKWLRSLYWRWKISHLLAVGRSKKTWKEKSKFICPILIPLAIIGAKIRK